MVTLRKGAETLDAPEANPNNNSQIDQNGQTNETQKISGYEYEQYREERIKENRERMQKLGIFDLSLKFKSVKPNRRNLPSSASTKTPRCLSPLPPPPGPTRRSSRLQNVTPVIYSEVNLTKKDMALEEQHDLLGEGSRPEVYTEEHEKRLGNTETSWTLFVDGVGQDGKRIYDPVKGKTCHQCRQKTLGHRTHCSKCGMVQGQFCGDCLYMRYGEHVLEANQNPDWICPVCRGICNCSLCRQAKGWPPTGSLYRKISQLGFKSVAHYLIQTHRSQTDSGKIPNTNIPDSAKRSLLFSDVETTSEGTKSPISNNEHPNLVTPKDEENTTNGVKTEVMELTENEHGANNIASNGIQEPNKKSALTSEAIDAYKELSNLKSEDKKVEKLQISDYQPNGNNVAPESTPKLKRKSPRTPEPTPDSVAGRLRQRRRTGDDGQREEMIGTNDSFNSKQAGDDGQREEMIGTNDSFNSKQAVKDGLPSESRATPINPSADNSIAGRLRLRRERA